jgi:hypothetical protein
MKRKASAPESTPATVLRSFVMGNSFRILRFADLNEAIWISQCGRGFAGNRDKPPGGLSRMFKTR